MSSSSQILIKLVESNDDGTNRITASTLIKVARVSLLCFASYNSYVGQGAGGGEGGAVDG